MSIKLFNFQEWKDIHYSHLLEVMYIDYNGKRCPDPYIIKDCIAKIDDIKTPDESKNDLRKVCKKGSIKG